jgi:predicted lipoprotein with Yx(FWY)xxD motif
MIRWTTVLAGTAALVLTAGACGSSGSSSSTTAPTTVAGAASGSGSSTTAASRGYSYGGAATSTPATSGGAAQAATVSVATNKLGKILVGPDGKTLYVLDKDPMGTSTCTGACEQAWPPLAPPASGSASYGSGLSASMFSVITRPDGSKQLAVNGHPLYGWIGDKSAGQTTGQGVENFYVVGTNGQKIDES